MKFRFKLAARIIALTLSLVAAGSALALDLVGILDKAKNDSSTINEKGAQERTQIRSNTQPTEIARPVQSETIESKPPQLVIPKDKKIAVAMEEALPIIEKVLSLHQCMKESQALRQLNIFAIPGLDMIKRSDISIFSDGIPNGKNMKFHDRNKCVSVTTIDSWSMPALNALIFRAVYFAEDSGETVNYLYMFKRVDDGSWKLSQLEKGR